MPYVEYDEVEAACPECGRLFRSEEALRAHVAESHAVTEAAPKAAKPVRCSLCRRTFPTTSALARHNRSAHTS